MASKKSRVMFILAGLSLATGAVAVMWSRPARHARARMNAEAGRSSRDPLRQRHRWLSDRIDQQSEASFPASDAPSWGGIIAGGSH